MHKEIDMTETKGSVLIVEDDREMRQLLVDLLGEAGYAVESIPNAEEALETLTVKAFDLLISDLKLEGLSGIDLLRKVKEGDPEQAVIIITAFGTVASAIEAMKAGAIDYLVKPFKQEHLLLVVEKAFERIRLHQEVLYLRQEMSKRFEFSNMIGKSKAMQAVFQLIQRVSESTISISITGESGTGKEVVARAIHYNSPRKRLPFMAIDCASIPETLLESELFGHVRGAFTDAKSDKKGLFEAANGGTLFLDEIAEIPLSLQPKLLRAIQEKAVRPVGSTRTLPVDIRIISATNVDLLQAVKSKRFRDDLYYRLNVLQIDIPPLRSRRDDIALLSKHFLKKFLSEQNKKSMGFSESALHVLLNYAWPGNVRELENAIERAVTLAQKDTITAEDFPKEMIKNQGDQVVLDQALEEMSSLDALEKEYVMRVLTLVNGNKAKAAKVLQIDRKTLYRKLHQYRAPYKSIEEK